MTRYFIHYKTKRWADCAQVEATLITCGKLWKHNVSPTVLRLDSELTPMELQGKMNSVLKLNHEDYDAGDTYYLTEVGEYRSHCHWTKLN